MVSSVLPRHRFAGAHVIGTMISLAVLASRYGYHRDELYFRMLPPACAPR